MNDYNAEGNYYTIGHMTQFTGLSDRTVRNYISMGILQGEKINGIWHFSPEQVDAFMRHPMVRPSILAKNNSVVYDFLLDDQKKAQQSCMIFDFPGEDEKKLMEYFNHSIMARQLHDFRYALDCAGDAPRVILKGHTAELLDLIGGYYRQ